MSVEDRYRGLSLPDFSRPDIASDCLAGLLRDGELALLLGAGVSQACGLPSWEALVKGCETELGLAEPASADGEDDAAPRSGEQLTAVMETVRRKFREDHDEEQFRQLVRRNLYPEAYLSASSYPDELLGRMMLIALGALVMPSARGSIRDIVTLNFDDLLEWYLELHGFTSRSVTNLPTNLSSQADATVFHPHGYLPLRPGPPATDWMVLTSREFIKRIARTSGNVWPRFLSHLFATKVLLVVGARLEDIDLSVHFEEASEGQPTGRIFGFVINSSFSDAERSGLLDRGLVPVAVGSHTEVPHFLLQVCRKASLSHQHA